MKIRMSLKLALFAFLSALACTITNFFIAIVELGIVADILWFLSYICLVVWVCKYIATIKKLGQNLVVTFFTFSIALYSGIYSGIYSELAEESLAPMVGELLFYAATIACLASVLVLIGRWVFGNPNKQDEETPIIPNTWTCVCGTTNTSKFCSECGCSKPEETVKPVIEAEENECRQ